MGRLKNYVCVQVSQALNLPMLMIDNDRERMDYLERKIKALEEYLGVVYEDKTDRKVGYRKLTAKDKKPKKVKLGGDFTGTTGSVSISNCTFTSPMTIGTPTLETK